MGGGTHDTAGTQVRGQAVELVLSFYFFVGSGAGTQVTRLTWQTP